MQSPVKTLALLLSLQSPFAVSAGNHSDEILEACPNLKDGAVPTQVINSDLTFNEGYYNSITLFNGDITDENATTTRDDIIFTNEKTTSLIMINSDGGNVYASRIIINAMNYTNDTVTVCANNASSAALDVLASGTYRYAMEDCLAVSHSIRGSVNRMAQEDLINYAQEIGRLDEKSREVLTSDLLSDQCHSVIREPKNGDTTLNSHDLLSLGIIDAVLMPNYQMKVRSDDLRIAYQACYTDKTKDKELSDVQIDEAYKDCYDQHIAP